MAESEEELKSLLMKVKEESEKVGLKLNIQKTKIMASGPITSWEIDGETVETVSDFIFLGSKITADADCSHEIKRRLLLGRKVMTNLDSILKSRDITWPTKVRLVKAMVFPVVMYGCESWTVKKADRQRIDAFELWCWRRLLRVEPWCWRRLLRVPWTARRSNQSILKEIDPECSLEGLMLKLKLQSFGHLMRRVDSLEKTLMLGRIGGVRRRGRQRMRWLDGITDSMEVVEPCLEGVCKPDPRMYKLCLEWLGWQPFESIFLDDLGPNLKAAAGLGIHTIKVHDPETAIKELETLGISIKNGCCKHSPCEKDNGNPQRLLGEVPQRLTGDPSHRMMDALVNAGAHVPKVLHLCEDSSIVGNRFYLMEYCPGLINKDPSPPGLEPSQRRAISTAMNRVLCKIHSVDLKAAGLEDYGKHGQASSATAKQTGKLTEFMSNLAWDFPVKEGFQVFKEIMATKPLMGSHHSWSRPQSLLRTPGTRSYVTSTDSSPAHASKGALIFSPEGLSPRVRELYQQLKEFMERHVYPAEPELQRHQASAERWTPSPLVEGLKEKAKAEGLWNLFLSLETDPEKKYGAGLTNVEYAHLCEVMGTSLYAPEIFNCSAPDTGNMELLVRYGTEEQKARWLIPLLEGKARSCFAMTEPQVASSDATNIESSIREEDGFYIINGHKWWITGILDPRCQLCVFMGKTDPHAPRHQQQSMFLVPMDTPGIKIIRPLRVYGLEDAPGGHGEVLFEQVRVPKENMVLGPGRGFEILLGRLGSGRIHHCMRLIGCSERVLALMKARAKSRVAFGKPLIEQGTVLADIALSRVEMEQTRLLVLKAAHVMDVAGNKAAALDIAMIKMVAPFMASRVIDRAIQVFGAAGLSSDHPLAQFFVGVRVLRLADQVHQRSVAKMELKHRS
ncbi:acyl-CoA dehydrogenase family member 10 isoform X8 [Moschus berezovskii]|uniref:acyl-CoA dehydrogenase family member 10 isoform X8 n=1 Tax=Moschus berezovskii TaxID=68408 RepID=UPI002444543F|nr:acyl-CoA dehydrogenase family member 10 isoform X8 [Moschus berezovskii]